MVCDGLDGLRERILLGGDYAEDVLDLGLGAGNVHVTHYDDGLVAGVVPGVVEVYEGFRLEGLQVLLRADEGAAGLFGVRAEVVGESGLHAAPGCVAAGAALLDDDTAFGVDFLGLVKHEVGIVSEDHEAAVHDALPLYGDVVEHILCFLEAGRGVDVAAELCSDGTEVVQDGLAGEVLGAVEAHVLQEVGQTVLLGVFLLDGTYVGGQVELCTAGRKLIVANVIGETVVQVADGHLLGVRKLGHLRDGCFQLLTAGLLRHCHNACYDEGCKGKNGFFH